MATMTPLSSSVLKQYAFFGPMTPTTPPEQNLSFTYTPTTHQSVSLSTATNNRKHTIMVAATPPQKEIFHEYPFFDVYTDNSVNVKRPLPTYLPINNPRTKDVKIKIEDDAFITARLFLPKNHDNEKKLPVVLYFHGSGFCSRSALSAEYTNHVADIANQANVLAVSVEYSKFPVRPLPACYEEALKSFYWIASHTKDGEGKEPWLKDYADLKHVFVAGNNAGGNITHYVVSQLGRNPPSQDVNVEGAILVHPFFGGLGADRQWLYMCKDNKGPEDPRLKPAADDFKTLGCKRVLVCVAETDPLRPAGEYYHRDLKKSGWIGDADLDVNWGIGHSDQVYKPYEEKSGVVVERIASFINAGNSTATAEDSTANSIADSTASLQLQLQTQPRAEVKEP